MSCTCTYAMRFFHVPARACLTCRRQARQPTEDEIDLARRHGTDGSEPRSADEYCLCRDCRLVRRWDHEQLNQETGDV